MKKRYVLLFITLMMIAVPVLADEANPLGNVTCGGISQSFPAVIPNLISLLITGVRVFVPVVLIVMGMIDFSKAVISSDEKTMSKAKTNFIRRTVIAVIIFLIVSIIIWIFQLLAPRSGGEMDETSIVNCINCFIEGSDSSYCTPSE
ncbi:MAG: hypothetical protein R3Y21_02030 [Mycoplasmatota bacterium]